MSGGKTRHEKAPEESGSGGLEWPLSWRLLPGSRAPYVSVPPRRCCRGCVYLLAVYCLSYQCLSSGVSGQSRPRRGVTAVAAAPTRTPDLGGGAFVLPPRRCRCGGIQPHSGCRCRLSFLAAASEGSGSRGVAWPLRRRRLRARLTGGTADPRHTPDHRRRRECLYLSPQRRPFLWTGEAATLVFCSGKQGERRRQAGGCHG